MVAYNIVAIEDVSLVNQGRLEGMDLMSPFVWREEKCWRMLFRAVPRPFTQDSPTGMICCAQSNDGLTFQVEEKPAIAPGSLAEDAGGAEDPTVLESEDGYLVFYTGVDAARRQASLLVAQGPDLAHLKRQAVILKAPPGEGNIKEATLAQTPAGDWRLFYEYAANNASRIGMASGPTADGPWTVQDDPFGVREDSWDNWHLSTGPIAMIEGHDPVMFYNGATVDARWRIGWVAFDPTFSRVVARGLEPLLVPPPPVDRAATDIAFAASCIVEEGRVSLYFSLEDRILRRAKVEVSDAAETSRPDPAAKAGEGDGGPRPV